MGSPVTMQCTWGFALDIEYALYDANGNPFVNYSGLQAYEDLTGGLMTVAGQTGWIPDVFGSAIGALDANGHFHDTPYGYCDNRSNLGPATVTTTQAIYFNFVGQRYDVRTNSPSYSATGQGQGTVTNGVDVNVTR